MSDTGVIETSVVEVRRRTRAAQHIASYPLLVIGVLFVNYGVFNFIGQPVEWRYGSALAFVALWGLGKVNESEVGVGPPSGEFLAVAAGVFTATQLTSMDWVARRLGFDRLAGTWVLIVGAGLLAVGLARHERSVAAWGAAVAAAGLALAIANNSPLAVSNSNGTFIRIGQNLPVVWIGVALTVVGLLNYQRERRVG
ncbi:MAG: hypothetical protein QOC79_258 [Actinomycetota bacterium]|jgi:hypothetical protein|nr:hypothetical protein [Actinomycetota bacterium]